MPDRPPSKATFTAGVLLVGAVVVVAINTGGEKEEGDAGARSPGPRLEAKSGTLRPPSGADLARRERSRLEREIGDLPQLQLRESLPDVLTDAHTLNNARLLDRYDLLFRRMGELDGELAMDEIALRYGNQGRYTTMAMVSAIRGWMHVDREAALAAFRELTTTAFPDNFGLARMSWKGTNLVSGFG